MELRTSGHPLHSRALTVTVRSGEAGVWETDASLLDLRKRGFVPVAGDLQGAGVVHHMQIGAAWDAASLVLRRIGTSQPVVAFEPSVVTVGESCRDPAAGLAALAGRSLAAGFAGALGAEVGGPRGCTHVQTLAQRVAATARALAERADPGGKGGWPWRPGERAHRSDLILDAGVRGDGRLEVAVQAQELWLQPAAPAVRPMQRFAEQVELRMLAVVDAGSMRLEALRAAERRRGARELAEGVWRELAPALEELGGLRLGPGVSPALLRHFAALPQEARLLEVLLQLTPAVYQALAALHEGWPAAELAGGDVVGVGAPADSCYMWRSGGALLRARAAVRAPGEE